MANEGFDGLRVLIVEDERVMRQLITRFLAQLGIYDVATAADGFEAMNKFSSAEQSFDLIICDVGMPNMNGVEFAKRLRSSDDLPDHETPILVLTGHAEAAIVQEAVQAGVQGFVVKPVSKKDLGARISAIIKKA